MLLFDVVGVETNLFDLGVNSLLMVKVSSCLVEVFGWFVLLVDMFWYLIVWLLVEFLDGDADVGVEEVLRDSYDRV